MSINSVSSNMTTNSITTSAITTTTVRSLMNVFTNFSLRSNIKLINGNSFTQLFGFGMMIDSNTTYYVLDKTGGKVYILDEQYNYIAHKSFSTPCYMATTGSTVYISSLSNVYKTDKYLNLLSQFTSTNSPSYRGIYYNSTSSLIYVAAFSSRVSTIDVFNSNLTFNGSIQLLPYTPYSISSNNNQLYVGTSNGTILVLVNNIILRSFSCIRCSTTVISIIFDQLNNIGILIDNTVNMLFLYNSNSTLSTIAFPRFVGFDSQSRFVILSYTEIRIYY